MSRRRYVLLIMTAVLAGVLVASSSFAQPGRGLGGRVGPGPRLGAPLAQGLQLTDDQRTKLEALMTEMRPKMQAAREQVRSIGQQLRAELLAEKPDEAKIKQLRGDLLKAQQTLAALRLDHQTRLAQILTPEQRKRLRERSVDRAFAGAVRGLVGRPGARMGWGRAFVGRGRGWGAAAGPFIGPFGPWAGPGPRRLVGRGVWGFGWWWR
jgi:Spy/CpxP family protein refolding chaperone